MGRFILLAVAISALSACEKKSNSEGLPPAGQWNANPGDMPPVQQQGRANNPHGGMGGGANPHAGIDMGGGDNPHAGVDMSGGDNGGDMGAANPHAGVDMGGDMSGANPHAGVDMGGGANPHAGVDMSGGGTDVGKLGLPP